MADGVRKVRDWRRAHNVTLAEMGALVDASPSQLSLAERGLRGLSPLLALRVARLIGVPVSELVSGREE